MKIRRIQLYRFRGFEDLQIIFPTDAKLLVFIGENGSGKTSFIEGIAMILQDTLYKHHRYDRVNWQNPQNVNTNHEHGSIAIGLQGAESSYDFSQALSANRMRFVSEDKLVLEKNRDLTEEEKIEHYQLQAKIAENAKLYDKALGYSVKLAKIQENLFGLENDSLARTYRLMGIYANALGHDNEALANFNRAVMIQEKVLSPNDKDLAKTYYCVGIFYRYLKKYHISLEYYQKALHIQEKVLDANDINLAYTYNNTGMVYRNLNDNQEAIKYFLKSLSIKEKILSLNDNSLLITYQNLEIAYNELGNQEKANYYKEKAKEIDNNNEIQATIPELYRTNDKDQLQHLNEYLEVELPLILQYNARQGSIENYKDALPIAFAIPMTTNFDMISDWFTEYENEENRKRLRINAEYRIPELQIIREIITKGLSLLNGSDETVFTELQTEIDETVKDGTVSSWLSIKKNGVLLHVSQLSDGEKRVLILLIDISRRLINLAKINKVTNYLEGKGIVLIDEIEQHLHPKWQRTLLPTLSKLFPNLQFVVTTHSPLVVSNLFQQDTETDLLRVNKDALVYHLTHKTATIIQTAGRDVANVLGEYFGVERRAALYQRKIDELFIGFEKDEIDIPTLQNQLVELKKLLGANDPDVKSAENIINGLID